MVEPDTADHARLRRVDNVRGIQPTAQAHFQHHDIALAGTEMLQGHRGHQLELGGMVAANRLHGLGVRAHRLHRTRQLPLRDIAPVHADALLET